MGLASSQARLLLLTARRDDVEGDMMSISMERMSLARKTERLSTEYSDSLNATKLVWNENGCTDLDLTYNLLMKPNSSNMGQYMIADTFGRAVLNDSYADVFGQGQTGGSNTGGITLASFLMTEMGIDEASANSYINGYTIGEISGGSSGSGSSSTSMEGLVGDVTDIITEDPIISAPNATEISLATYTNLKNALLDMQEILGNSDDDPIDHKMKENVQVALNALEVAYTSNDTASRMAGIATIKMIFTGIPAAAVLPNAWVHKNSKNMPGTPGWTGQHTNTQGWATGHVNDFFKNGGLGEIAYGQTYVDNMNSLLDAYEDESSTGSGTGNGNGTGNGGSNNLGSQDTADFYISMWHYIDKNGWVRSSSIDKDDGSYLQNLILNGAAHLCQLQDDGTWEILDNSEAPMQEESDEEAMAKAEAKYDAAKDQIESKEKMLDLRLNSLDTERSAVVTEIDSVKKLIDKNIETNFKMFQA